MKLTKKSCALIGAIILLSFIFISDDIQQRRFYNLNCGYKCMEKGKYAEAVSYFNEYLDVKSQVYWFLIEKVSGYESSREGVTKSRDECIRREVGNESN